MYFLKRIRYIICFRLIRDNDNIIYIVTRLIGKLDVKRTVGIGK